MCKSEDLKEVLDLGMTPLANNYLTKEELDKPETYYPLILNECKECKNVQLAHVVNPDLMFKNYLYESSTSPVFVKHFEDFANKMGKKKFVIDIGGNDGILLKPFQNLGSKVLNVDPSDIKCGVPTIREYFTSKLAKKILKKYGKADLITATNVFAHADDLDDILEGVKILLDKDGQFVVEVTNLNVMLEQGTFDLIYHEHVNYWSVPAFERFFTQRGMYVDMAESISTHGGSIRIYARL